MKVLAVKQNTWAWHHERMRRPTASEFDRIITTAGKPSDQARRYQYELIFQRIYGAYACSVVDTPAILRGRRLEGEAISAFISLTGRQVFDGMFIISDDGKIGCSPDGWVLDWEGVEIKCPDGWRHMMYTLEGPLKDYKAQLQGLMLVAGFARMHFFSYHPAMPCVVHVIERDEAYIAELDKLLTRFVGELEVREAQVRALGNYGPIE